MEDNQKRYIDKVAEIIVRDTIIDYDNEEITFPFMGGYDPYPFRHLTPYHYIFFTKPTPLRENLRNNSSVLYSTAWVAWPRVR